ncbi:UDP-N-acetylmuramate--L-alanine ligase [Blochmannia endosymbiont of Camponotus sp. C-003]|uniref:UDP-N-acetylmuramate--L-alanine ligase n=1 Tax=Blochmannia endosymbiont of Camponotus sp. C-003 TaxID=2945588 RepID=UPI002023FC40|nr:UDP-N-acetylmuramate--L-alanine ligase [Blochmannia endosymbiont of Camponotus sp. C-003]URJ23100.1 UDP-N-acetylmuramate--L-alanine ligase [Blochmannia endosymbiont of Camponotus sp. C-003]
MSNILCFGPNNAMPMMNRIKQIHFVGIGGVGMGGIAEILVHEGYCITGSDIMHNSITRRLFRLGVTIYIGHKYSNINNANVVVISSAIYPNNPEILAAQQARIPIIQRAEMLSELMRFKYGIAISGTHGKTTTTTMIASIYIAAGLDPTFINGGIIKSENAHARIGYGRYLIVEADESDNSFLHLHPMVEVITNIDTDHIHQYQGNFKYLKQAFINFVHNLPFYGYAIVCLDDPVICEILPKINRKTITYGFHKNADLHIFNYHQNIDKSNFTILRSNQTKLQVTLNAPGYHNALNATAAIAVATEEGISDRIILKTMLDFQGTHRRFENLGHYSLNKINGQTGKILLIDDYGHHPAELHATIATIRTGWPDRRLIMVFQPHRYTRIKELYHEFVGILSNVDILLILNVYSAGEPPILGVNSQSLCRAIRAYGKVNPIFIPNTQTLSSALVQFLRNNDLLLIQGAGTVGEVVRRLIVKHD